MTARIEVDFNSRDDLGRLPAPMSDADHLEVGQIVDAFDDDGNRCLARVSALAGGWASLAPFWETFADEESSRLLPAHLDQFTRALSRLSFEVAATRLATNQGVALQGSSVLT